MKLSYFYFTFLMLAGFSNSSAFTVAIPEAELEFLREVIGPDEEIEFETSRQKNLSDYTCYENGHKKNEFWALRWEDQFKKETFDDWAMVVENKYCSGHGVDHVSCDVSSNIALRSGALVLNAARQKYYAHDYTGAQVSTTVEMAFDRIEIRAAQPLGSHLHTSMFAYNDQSAEARRLKQYAHNFFVIDLNDYRQDVGWIEIASHIQRPSIMHGIHQQKFDKANADHVYREAEVDDLNEFHTYGMIWNQSLAQFSFDQNLTEPFSNHLNRINTKFQIVLMIGVGGDHFKEPTNSFSALQWLCPALVIDYIRVFDKVNQTGNLPKCQFPEPLSNDVIADICQFALSKSGSPMDSPKAEKLTKNDSRVALISSIVLTGVLLVFMAIFVLIKLGVLENPISKLRAMYSKDESIIGYDRQADVHSQS